MRSRQVRNSGSSSATYRVLGQSYLKNIINLYIIIIIIIIGPMFLSLIKASVIDVDLGNSCPTQVSPIALNSGPREAFLYHNLVPVLKPRKKLELATS